jgi:hypothetical protein
MEAYTCQEFNGNNPETGDGKLIGRNLRFSPETVQVWIGMVI